MRVPNELSGMNEFNCERVYAPGLTLPRLELTVIYLLAKTAVIEEKNPWWSHLITQMPIQFSEYVLGTDA